jgi:LemA protein
MKMNKKAQLSGLLIALIVIVVFIGIIFMMIVGTYNSLVGKDTSVQTQWGKVQSAYQRRLDLIPNLVATVKGSADFEKTTQTQIAQLRSGVNNAKNPSDLQTVDTGVNSLIRNINVQLEAYPQLTSTANFRALQDELAGTENRVKFERDNYNDEVKNYANAVRMFPSNFFAGMFGFSLDKWKTFKATQGAENPPQVNFSS